MADANNAAHDAASPALLRIAEAAEAAAEYTARAHAAIVAMFSGLAEDIGHQRVEVTLPRDS